jgi:hypothetical protein
MMTGKARRVGVANHALDLLGYALVVDGVLVVAALAVSVPFSGTWVVTEAVLFVVGFLLFGYATLLAWPSEPETADPADGTTSPATGTDRSLLDFETGARGSQVERAVRALPVFADYCPPADEQLPVSGKLYFASVVVLATSFAIERLLVV